MADADYPAELQQLHAAYSQLESQLKAKTAEVEALKELADSTAHLQSQDVQAAKVIELSKKNRNLTLALEREKARSSSLEQALAEQGHTKHMPHGAFVVDPSKLEEAARTVVQEAAEAADAAQREAFVLRDRLSLQTNKLAQLEQKVVILETENKKLTRALVREVGEEVPLSRVLEAGSDWKGRREQIIALRDQIKALKTVQGQAPASDTKFDGVHKNMISKMSKDRTAEMDRLAAELATVKGDLQQAQMKLSAGVSRKKVLEAEVAALKEKLTIILDKTKNDDRLIAALKAELTHAKRQAAGAGSASGDDTYKQLVEARQRLDEQEDQIDKQQEIIKYLQAQAAGKGAAAGSRQQQHADALQEENQRLNELVNVLEAKLKEMRVAESRTASRQVSRPASRPVSQQEPKQELQPASRRNSRMSADQPSSVVEGVEGAEGQLQPAESLRGDTSVGAAAADDGSEQDGDTDEGLEGDSADEESGSLHDEPAAPAGASTVPAAASALGSRSASMKDGVRPAAAQSRSGSIKDKAAPPVVGASRSGSVKQAASPAGSTQQSRTTSFKEAHGAGSAPSRSASVKSNAAASAQS